MSSCGSNSTLFINRPTKDNSGVNCACGDFNPAGRCNPGIGPRKKREKVREDIKDFVLVMLGAPVVKIELDMQNLDAAVDQALKIFQDYAPREYFEYYVFNTTPGKSVYELAARCWFGKKCLL